VSARTLVLGLGAAVLAAACLELARFDELSFRDGGGGGAQHIFEHVVPRQVDKVDILLTIDNTRAMAEKQLLLAGAVKELLTRLANPWCIDADGSPSSAQPLDGFDSCPKDGTRREFDPVSNIHIGILSSSLGGHGSDSCVPAPGDGLALDDRGELRVRRWSNLPPETYRNLGFLLWDPEQAAHPPGENAIGHLTDLLVDMTRGVGDTGCLYPAPLESWYRFLIDPTPFDRLELERGQIVGRGTDTLLLGQRHDFLRPDSLLLIVMLGDANDCSIRDGADGYLAGQQLNGGTGEPFHPEPGRRACELDPASPCCVPCNQKQPSAECPHDGRPCQQPLTAESDPLALRCFHQKQRFGVDFLYDVDRYVQGLTAPTVADRAGQVVTNPIFDPGTAPQPRDPSLVLLAGIVGVPWQDIARVNPNSGKPDLASGANPQGSPVGGFMTAAELADAGVWSVILTDPAEGGLAGDPLMRESILPRSGVSPVVDEKLAPPDAGPQSNSVNGHERTIAQGDDLQYACIFPLADSLDCSAAPPPRACDCSAGGSGNPLCQAADGSYSSLQLRAKAYPSLRQLALLERMGALAVVASTCAAKNAAAQADDRDYGYLPAVSSLLERSTPPLQALYCLEHELPHEADGRTGCLLIEARHDAAQACDCHSSGRRDLEGDELDLLARIDRHRPAGAPEWNCHCALEEAAGDALGPCQTQVGEPVLSEPSRYVIDAWCYIDASTVPQVGYAPLAAGCPADKRRVLRLVGAARPPAGAGLFLVCG
jgi:hypothetical protein